ncbi:MAG: pyruvate dehydrogenase (acetyl-transferring), homodimeric type, partial [Gammaproteobacteria bacterium]
HELAVIVEYGIRRMYDEKHDEFFYITLMNENYPHPSLPDGTADDIIRGMYLYDALGESKAPRLRLLGSGTILRQVIEAAHLITEHFEVRCEIYSVTSFSELARDAQTAERRNRLTNDSNLSQISKYLAGGDPIVCATDYVRSVPSQISPYVTAPFRILGTDGFGRSANRTSLREFFEVNAKHMALAAVTALIETDALPNSAHKKAIDAFGIDTEALEPPPWER